MIPLDLTQLDQRQYEEIYISETFIDHRSSEGEVISCSVEKKGYLNQFTYTQKVNLLVKGQRLLKKKNISAAEYIQAKSQIKKESKTLKSKRLCIISDGVYVIVDYFPEIDGAPMLGIIQVRRGNQSKIDLPNFVKVHREVTD